MRTEFEDRARHGIAAESVATRGEPRAKPQAEGKKIPATYCRREVMSDSFFVS
jgi:hypothetical protein